MAILCTVFFKTGICTLFSVLSQDANARESCHAKRLTIFSCEKFMNQCKMPDSSTGFTKKTYGYHR